MEKTINSYSFLAIGKTAESTEQVEFKRYVGLASSFVKAVNPTKKELDEFFGFESQNEPEYIKDTDNGKEAYVTFLIETDPSQNNNISLKSRAMFTLRLTPAYNRDNTKVQVLDQYGNYTWADIEDAKNGKVLEGQKIDSTYRMACVGECDLIAFLKAYLVVPEAFDFVNGVWTKKANAGEGVFTLEHLKDYFKGDFSELREALALQPNNKVKLLYGVRTNDEGKQYQAVCTKGDMVLRNSAGSKAVERLAKNLADAKARGSYANTDFRVCELQEWTVEPTNLEAAPAEDNSGSDLPWD